MKRTKYDVIIIGAGVSGVSAALNICKENKNLKILIVDKSKFPRNKLCAGYLTAKSVSLLKDIGIEVENFNYKLIKGIRIIYKNKTRIKADNHGLYHQKLVDRTVLDYELFKKLKEHKIEVKENAQVEKLNKEESWILIDNIRYCFQYLVFADGELGYSSRFNNEKKKYFAMQMTFKHKSVPKIDMYFGITKKGYAWCASSGVYTNIGFCDIYNKSNDYEKICKQFVQDLGFTKQLKRNKIKGFFVPYGLKKNMILSNNIFFIGDAVGAVDPLTLAGISYALLSGKYVAKSILVNDNNIYLSYLQKLKYKFTILKIMVNALYNPVVMFLFIRVGGHFFGRPFSFILDKLVLNKNNSFHE